ncbi:metallophosphoesterase [Psychrosphaera ytuae]|uniref:Metallophosphoesterase n=1 Tax=Psychrosphaera ytuae TaxID=2820710 RepID=A0A975HKQ5_9GAMM|nr:metallophosphoesterase [Psychrosphaera ytuae]QTH64544.1 metallophosphoesterase [Psychrosphaera ytuae]
MKIAIISDLHIGDYARAKDFTPNDSEHSIIDDYLGSFSKKFSDDEYKCDALLIAGDITNKAQYEEFELAEERIKDIADILKVPHDAIFLTPGNHDSNWELGRSIKSQGVSDEQQIREARYQLFNGNKFIKDLNNRATFGQFHVSPYCVLWCNKDLSVLSFNTSANDNDEKNIHHGEISLESIQQIKTELEKHKSLFEDKIKVLLFHHHPVNYIEKTFSDVDHSIMANANALIELGAEYCFDFLVHGHKHIPRYSHLITDVRHPMNILCAGSFVARLDDRWFDDVGNAFHIIEIDQNCAEQQIPQGRILSWSHFVQHGWIQNNSERDSIPHESRFGSSYNRKTLKLKIKNIILELFSTEPYIKWTEIESRDKDIKYSSSVVLSLVLEELENELDFIVYKEPEIILLKKEGGK